MPNSSTSSSDAGRIARRIAVFGLVQVAILAGLLLVWLMAPKSDRFHQDYLFGVIDGAEHLTRASGARRVVLLGGSSYGFSVSAEALERRLGVAVVNLGVHARYGFLNMWETYRPRLDASRDLIVLSPEYLLFSQLDRYSDMYCQVRFLEQKLTLSARAAACLPDIIRLSLWDLVYRARGKTHPRDVYFRDTFNRHGDATAHYDLPQRPFAIDAGFIDVPRQMLDQYVALVRDRIIAAGFPVLYVPTVLPRSSCGEGEKITALQNKLLTAFRQAPITDWRPLCYPDEVYFDTWYHMRRPGVEQRTREIGDAIAAALAERSAR